MIADRSKVVVYTGGHRGTEAEFGRQAERWGLQEVTLTFDGHVMERGRNERHLSDERSVRAGVLSDSRSGRIRTRSPSVVRLDDSCGALRLDTRAWLRDVGPQPENRAPTRCAGEATPPWQVGVQLGMDGRRVRSVSDHDDEP